MRCTKGGKNVLHLRILVYSMPGIRTIINDRDLVTLVKNRPSPLTFYIGFLVFLISFEVRRKRGYLYVRGYNDTIVYGVPDKLGEDNPIRIKSGATLIPCQSRMPTTSGVSSGLTMILSACKSVCHSTGNDITSGGKTCGMAASI